MVNTFLYLVEEKEMVTSVVRLLTITQVEPLVLLHALVMGLQILHPKIFQLMSFTNLDVVQIFAVD